MKQIIYYVVVPQEHSNNVRLLVFKWNNSYQELDLIHELVNMFPDSDFEEHINNDCADHPKRYNIGDGYGNKKEIELIKLNNKTY